jgi:hypothetical protein
MPLAVALADAAGLLALGSGDLAGVLQRVELPK